MNLEKRIKNGQRKKVYNSCSQARKRPVPKPCLARGRKEKYLEEINKDFRFILHKETKHFEIKVIYYIDQTAETVYPALFMD